PVLPQAVPAERPVHANGVANAAQLLVPGGRPLVAQNPANPNQPVPPQARLMQIEERLVREAQNLNLEQAQLATIRVFEGELARLRASYANTGPVSAGSSAHSQNVQAQVTAAFARTAPVHVQQNANYLNANPMGYGIPQALPGYAFPQAYQPHHLHDPRTTGQSVVPQGMIIPPGWTLMPLQRHQPNNSLGQTTPPPDSSDDSTSAATSAAQAAVPSTSHSSTYTQQRHDASMGPPTSTEVPSSGSAQPPWSIPSWDFNGEAQPNSAQQLEDQSSVSEVAEVQQASTVAQSTSEPRANVPSKGKGRAVQVEDVLDGDG
ncbi:hypothetical protein LTR28_007873, partial [Elasticomyces elasticus]